MTPVWTRHGVRQAWRTGRMALLAAGLLVLAACDEALSQDQIVRTLAGNSIEGQTAADIVDGEKVEAKAYWVHFTDKGDIFMLVEDGFTDTGRWRATDDGKYCRTWRLLPREQPGTEFCFGIKKSGRTLEFVRDKSVLHVKLIEGNPQQLPRRDTQRRAP